MSNAEIQNMLASLSEAISLTQEIVKEARDVAEHARATAHMNEAMARSIMSAYKPIQIELDSMSDRIAAIEVSDGRV